MLAGCAAFTVHDEMGKKVAYYGFQIKDHKAKFHTSFNPELYLYNLHLGICGPGWHHIKSPVDLFEAARFFPVTLLFRSTY